MTPIPTIAIVASFAITGYGLGAGNDISLTSSAAGLIAVQSGVYTMARVSAGGVFIDNPLVPEYDSVTSVAFDAANALVLIGIESGQLLRHGMDNDVMQDGGSIWGDPYCMTFGGTTLYLTSMLFDSLYVIPNYTALAFAQDVGAGYPNVKPGLPTPIALTGFPASGQPLSEPLSNGTIYGGGIIFADQVTAGRLRFRQGATFNNESMIPVAGLPTCHGLATFGSFLWATDKAGTTLYKMSITAGVGTPSEGSRDSAFGLGI